MDSVRMDKWLWAARFFKTRALASKSCDLGRIQSNGQWAKAARDVRVGDMLQIKTEGGDFQLEVLGLSDVRGPAPVAQALYRETDESKILRQKVAEERKTALMYKGPEGGRPTKRDRREINRVRGRY